MKVRRQLAADPAMRYCWYVDEDGHECGGTPVEWNHALIVSGRRLHESFALVPLCLHHHRGNFGTIFPRVKEFCEYKAIERGIDWLKENHPKTDWDQRLLYLRNKYDRK